MFSRLLVPDTYDYMIAGYLILIVMLSGYILSIYSRWRKTKKEYLKYSDNEK